MKLTTVLLFVAVMQLSAEGYAQKLTLSQRSVSIEQIFKEIKRQTGYDVFYLPEVLDDRLRINANFQDTPIEDVLMYLIGGKGLTFSMNKQSYVIHRNPSGVGDIGESRAVTQQRDSLITVRGTVTDSTGQVLVGATLQLVGHKLKTTTSATGRFRLDGVPYEGRISVSYMGYQSVEVTAGQHLTIRLGQTTESMKEVVVTGLFERKTESFTGSTATFSQQELLEVGNTNIIRSLANLDASFRIMENLAAGSDPNHLPDITMRGQTGLPDLNNEYASNPNLPMFILDGFETNLQRILDLDMYLVKSVTLLKDAASKSVYGSRAANGVVVIQTVQPSLGRLQVSYRFNLNAEFPDLSSYNLLNARQKLELELMTDPILRNVTAWNSSQWFNSMDVREQYDHKLEEILRGVDTDWLREPLRNGYGQRHSLSLGGGTQEIRYSFELGYNDINGVMRGSGREIYNAGLNFSYNRGTVRFSNNLRLNASRGDNSPYGSFGAFAVMNPYLRAREADGTIPFTSPLYNGTVGIKNFTMGKSVTNNTNIVWTIRPSLRLNTRFSYSYQLDESDAFLPAAHNSFPRPNPTSTLDDPNSLLRGSYAKSSAKGNRLNGTVTLSFNQVFGNHIIYANAGGDANSSFRENYGFQVVGFPNPKLSFASAALQFAPNSRLNGMENLTRDMSFYSAVNYSYADRYLADASWRRSRSSQFGLNNPAADFWSMGLGWNIHNEAFMSSSSFFSMLRLTANTGISGSQPVSTYLAFPVYRYRLEDNSTYLGQYSLSLTAMANPDIQTQRRQDNSLNLNILVWRKRLNLSASYYVSMTQNLLVDISLPNSTGFSAYKANQGNVENRGVDMRLDMRAFSNSRGDFVSFYGTLGRNKNILKKLSNTLIKLTNDADAVFNSQLKQRYQEGQSLTAIWTVPSLGIDPATGNEVYMKADGTATYEWDPADQIVSGESNPTLFGNLGFNVRFRGWQFNASMAYNWGGQKYNSTLVNRVENANYAGNVDARIFTSRWRQPGDRTFFQGINKRGTTFPTSRFVSDWNEISMSSINVSYELNRLPAVRRMGIRGLRASIFMNNPFVLSSVGIERGTDYPFARNFSFSIDTNF